MGGFHIRGLSKECRLVLKLRVISVVGARPNFMKMAPVLRELSKNAAFECFLVHTGQDYNESMSRVFFFKS